MPTIASTLATQLSTAGIDIVFGLPGGETVEILEALRQHNIRFELVTNESSAVFMADATARLTGKPGVCLTTLGPGAMNAVAGVAHAYLDRAPVLIITAQTPGHLLSHHTHQVIDLQAVFTPITKKSLALTPDSAAETIATALRLTGSGRPGPVHLYVSSSDAAKEISATTPPVAPTLPDYSMDLEAVAAARTILQTARRPVILTGVGLEPEAPYAALRELAEAAQAPVISTPKSKGSLPDDHPLAVGTIGLSRTDPVYDVLDEADAIVAVGFDVVELVKPWNHPAPLIWIAPWANDDPPLAATTEFIGPMAPVLQQLADTGFETNPDWGAARVATHRQMVAADSLPTPMPDRILPQTVLETIRRYLPQDSMMTTDVGSNKIFTCLSWPTYAANRFMVSNGLSCMGFALPSAIAAGLVLRDQPVVCITGDAGLSMVLGELALLAKLQLPVIVVVMNDNAIDLIRSAQRRSGKPVYGTEFTSPNFAAIARAYQLDAYQASTEAECNTVIQQAIANARPALIEAMIDPVSYPTTPAAD